MSSDRPISVVLKEIMGNVRDIMRSEVRLATTEVRDEILRTRAACALVATGAFGVYFALSLILLTGVYALSKVVPIWAAALCMAAGVGIVGAAAISTGLRRFKAGRAGSKPAASAEENNEWTKLRNK
jgi:hypothetical protein